MCIEYQIGFLMEKSKSMQILQSKITSKNFSIKRDQLNHWTFSFQHREKNAIGILIHWQKRNVCICIAAGEEGHIFFAGVRMAVLWFGLFVFVSFCLCTLVRVRVCVGVWVSVSVKNAIAVSLAQTGYVASEKKCFSRLTDVKCDSFRWCWEIFVLILLWLCVFVVFVFLNVPWKWEWGEALLRAKGDISSDTHRGSYCSNVTTKCLRVFVFHPAFNTTTTFQYLCLLANYVCSYQS